jgi:hypothetical protein
MGVDLDSNLCVSCILREQLPRYGALCRDKQGLRLPKAQEKFGIAMKAHRAGGENPWVGTWKLDPAKSKLTTYPK